MGNKIILRDTSGNRLPKRPKPNQTELASEKDATLTVQTETLSPTPVGNGGGSSVIVSDTWNNWNNKKNDASLPLSTYVIVSDANGTDQGAVLMTNQFGNGFETNGIGYFINADFQNSGNYYSVSNFQGQFGVWYPELEQNPSFNTTPGAVTIWNCIHYVVIDTSALNGTEPDSNTSAYSSLTKTQGFGYVYEGDEIVFDFTDNYILWRKDKRGNVISYNSLNTFQFGDNNIYNVSVEEPQSYIYTYNNRGNITGVQAGETSYFYLTNNSGSIYFNSDGNYQSLYAPNNIGSIEAHINGFSAGLEAQNNSGDITTYIYDLSYVQCDNNTGDIYNRYYDSSSVSHINNAGDINFCEFKNGFVGVVSLNSSYSYLNNVFSNGSFQSYYYDPNAGFNFPSNISFDNCVLTNTESTFSDSIDITGISSINFNAFYNRNWCGTLNLTSSNSAETINSIFNIPNTKFTIVPGNGLSLTVNTVSINATPAVNSILATNIFSGGSIFVGRLDYPSDTFTIRGATFNTPISAIQFQ